MLSPNKIVDGMTGLTRALINEGVVAEQETERRINICRECPDATRNDAKKFQQFKGLTNLSQCRQCGCFIKAKARLDDSRCPVGKW